VSSQQVARVVEVAQTWAPHDGEAAAAAPVVKRQVQERFGVGVDVDATDPCTTEILHASHSAAADRAEAAKQHSAAEQEAGRRRSSAPTNSSAAWIGTAAARGISSSSPARRSTALQVRSSARRASISSPASRTCTTRGAAAGVRREPRAEGRERRAGARSPAGRRRSGTAPAGGAEGARTASERRESPVRRCGEIARQDRGR